MSFEFIFEIINLLILYVFDANRYHVFLAGDRVVTHDYGVVGLGIARHTVRQCDGFEHRDLLAVILQNVAAGLRDAGAGNVDDAARGNTHYVAAVDLNVEGGIAGLEQVLQTDRDGLGLGVRGLAEASGLPTAG